MSRALSSLQPKSPSKVLKELAEISAQARAGADLAFPTVTLHCRGGRDLTGQLFAVDGGRLEQTVLIIAQGRSAFTTNATYVSALNIEAVTVHDALNVGQPGEEIAVGRLELDRAIALCAATFPNTSIIVREEVVAADHEAIVSALTEITTASQAILSDPLGQEAFRPIERILFQATEAAAARRDNNTLHLDVARSFVHRPDAIEWQQEIERAL